MRLKDYAESRGVSPQSIYKKVRSQKYKERLKGHLYLDNEKVENVDLIGIKILEDYHFENDVMKLEKELEENKNQFKNKENLLLKQLDDAEKQRQSIKEYYNASLKNRIYWRNYAEELKQQRLYLIIALMTMFLAFLVAMGFAVF